MGEPLPQRFTEQHFKLAIGIANGKSRKELASEMGLSLKRTEQALGHAYRLLDLPKNKHHDAMFVHWAHRHGLLDDMPVL